MDVHWANYKLFPYERKLGLRELESLGARVVGEGDVVAAVGDPASVVHRSTYFDRISSPGQSDLTEQARVEAGHFAVRGSRGGRQATRYGLHGLHEYKGKFNPQVVRALCNIVDPDAGLLIDPFCGSGTALVEGMRLQMDVLGIDRSPMAHFLSRTKLEAMCARSKGRLAVQVRRLGGEVAEALDCAATDGASAGLRAAIGEHSVDYLQGWFSSATFAGLSRALVLLHSRRRTTARQLVSAALSSILREVSLQNPSDLRVRRRPGPFEAPAVAPLFLRAIEGVADGLTEFGDWPSVKTRWRVTAGNSSDVDAYAPQSEIDSGRLIVTSPPYAMALPYIDTDRLSLVALGLVDAQRLRAQERVLVGSREWTRAEQTGWDQRRLENADELPQSVTRLTSRIEKANAGGGAGFRRQAVPSLLYRYFTNMAMTTATWARVLSPGDSAVLIVGHNRTTAGGEAVDIDTPQLIAEVAESRGFTGTEIVELETWPRYGLHAANGIAGEDAVVISR